MYRYKLLLFSVLPGVLLWLAWPPMDFYILAFVAFVPLFMLEEGTREQKGYFWWVYVAMLIFNITTTWWVWNASAGGAIAMMLANSLLMTLPFMLYRKAIRYFGASKALFTFICFWMAFEYLHLNWEITWPWLSLGNVFAKHNYVVQWYEYTGMLGGSLWVLLLNILVFKAMKKAKPKAYLRPTLVFVIPLVFSLIIGVTVFKGKRYEVLLVQPNVDPYKDKFTAGEEVNTFRKMLELAEKEVTENTSYVIFPETAVVEYLDEDHIQRFKSIRLIDEFLQRHPQVHVISGVSSYNFYEEGEKPSPTARTTGNGRQYESYNTSMEMGPEGDITLYHKSKLVPGVEKMPYPQIFSFLEYFTLDMGGISGSLGSDNLPTVFKAGDKPDLAPLICYESVFPDLVRSFTSRGAKFIVVMTNDGWWGNTPGYKQHMYYASLRSIENRQEVVRSANTGISCHISATGKILDRTEWWQTDILKASVLPRQADTFYSRHGDYIGKIFSFFGVFFILGLFVRSRTKHT